MKGNGNDPNARRSYILIPISLHDSSWHLQRLFRSLLFCLTWRSSRSPPVHLFMHFISHQEIRTRHQLAQERTTNKDAYHTHIFSWHAVVILARWWWLDVGGWNLKQMVHRWIALVSIGVGVFIVCVLLHFLGNSIRFDDGHSLVGLSPSDLIVWYYFAAVPLP